MTDAKPHLLSAHTIAGAIPLIRRPRLRTVGGHRGGTEVDKSVVLSGAPWARRFRSRLRSTDIAVILVAVAAALLARFDAGGATIDVETIDLGPFHANYWVISAVIVTTWIATLSAFHTRDSRIIGVGASEYKQVINASGVAFGMLAICFLILQVDIARGFFILALPVGVAGLVTERWFWRRWLLRQRHFGHYLARAIVLGSRKDIEYVVDQIEQKTGAAYHVVGAAIESGSGRAIVAGNRMVPVVSDFSHVAAAAAVLGADTVIVAGQPRGGSAFIRSLGWELESTSADLVLSSRLTDVAGPRIHFRPVEGLPLIHVEIPHFEGAKHALKRILDVVASAAALVVLLPVLAAIGLMVKLDSPGPVLFRQLRCGRNEKTFPMLKFRSMVESAEGDLAALIIKDEGNGVLFKMRDDPRVTRIGRFIRKYSLDELPQLWNVLIGHMSLVGPRPPLPTEVESYESHVHRRMYIKPGLTGMWQVNGRSNLSWEDSVRLDLYYVENWSLTGDLMIIWRTFKTIVKPTGAY
jgi:exopolysaccharide biosynthesis polyprenyl glycosylphosphotransferase